MATRKGRRVWWYEPGSPTKQRRSKTFATEQAAQRFAEDREEDARLVKDGRLTAQQVEVATGSASLLTAALEEFNADRRHRAVTEDEIANSTGRITLVFDACKWVNVNDVSALHLKRVIRKLKTDRDWSARTVNRVRECLRGLFRWMIRNGLLTEDPTEVLDVLNVARDRRRISRALTVPEADSLVTTPKIATRRRLLYLLRLRTGLRCREASRVRWDDLDLDRGLILLRANLTKNGHADVLPIAADLDAALIDYQRTALRTGETLTPEIVRPITRATWLRDLGRAGIEWAIRGERADAKCLRRTFESHLLRSGCDPVITMLLMRHSPPGGMALTMGVYADKEELLRRKRAAVTALSTWLGEQRNRTLCAHPRSG